MLNKINFRLTRNFNQAQTSANNLLNLHFKFITLHPYKMSQIINITR